MLGNYTVEADGTLQADGAFGREDLGPLYADLTIAELADSIEGGWAGWQAGCSGAGCSGLPYGCLTNFSASPAGLCAAVPFRFQVADPADTTPGAFLMLANFEEVK